MLSCTAFMLVITEHMNYTFYVYGCDDTVVNCEFVFWLDLAPINNVLENPN